MQKDLTDQLQRIQEEQGDTRGKIQELQHYNEKLKVSGEEFERDWEKRENKYIDNLNELRRRYFNDKHYNQLLEEEHKGLQKTLRGM